MVRANKVKASLKINGVEVTCGPTLIPCHHNQWSLTSIKYIDCPCYNYQFLWIDNQCNRKVPFLWNSLFFSCCTKIFSRKICTMRLFLSKTCRLFFEWLIMFCDRTINRKAVRQIKSYRINKFNKSKQKTLSDFNIFGHNWKYISFWIL